jgi:hypothetical protein
MGFHFVKDWRLEIDYPRERIRFVSGSSPMADTGIPFESGVNDMAILFPAEVNGRGPYCFLLDTGASSSVVSPHLARELELSAPSLEGVAVSVLGNLQAQPVRLDSLATLGRTRRDVDAAVIDIFDFCETAVGGRVDGIVGYNFLKDSVVSIDYPAKRVALS